MLLWNLLRCYCILVIAVNPGAAVKFNECVHATFNHCTIHDSATIDKKTVAPIRKNNYIDGMGNCCIFYFLSQFGFTCKYRWKAAKLSMTTRNTRLANPLNWKNTMRNYAYRVYLYHHEHTRHFITTCICRAKHAWLY